jgi:hypothetical protein
MELTVNWAKFYLSLAICIFIGWTIYAIVSMVEYETHIFSGVLLGTSLLGLVLCTAVGHFASCRF